MDDVEKLKVALDQPIVMVGMMGVGKSRIGQALASALDLPFYDSDKIIEEKAGRPIPDVFIAFGEEKFRRAEQNTIIELLEQKSPCVIATGGGALTSPVTLEAIKEQGISVWLQADLDTTMKRLAGNANRPLLQTEDPRATVKALMEARQALYAQATLHVQTDEHSTQVTIDNLIKTLCFRVIPGSV